MPPATDGPSADRNLLFGVLALQADLLDNDRFAEACSAWAARKGTPLAQLLVERGWLTAEERSHVDFLLDRKLRKHGGDAAAGLAEAMPEDVRQTLAGLDDPAVRRTLDTTAPPGGVHERTTVAYRPAGRDRYTLTRLHARGGLGQVWVARDADLGREVALKELLGSRADDPVVLARFLEEAKITGQLEHPNIVPVYELARPTAGAGPFYTMRLIRGRTLAAAVQDYHARRRAGEAGPLELRELLGHFIAVCNAVAYAHSRGVLHRDLKPQNVVLGGYGEVIVLDWGLAKLKGAAEPRPGLVPVALGEDTRREGTVQGQAVGTPSYMPPEQAEGWPDLVDERSDVYGLGAVLYETLTGAPPFDGPNSAAILVQVVADLLAPPRRKVPATPPALEAVCLKALAARPADRYAGAGEVADEVRRWLADEPVAARREPLPARAGRWLRRHRQLVTAAAAVLLAALPLSLALAANREQARRQAEQAERETRKQKEIAENRDVETRAVLDFVENKVFAAARPERQAAGRGGDVTLRKALEDALPFVDQSFRDRPLIEARLRMSLGTSFHHMGEWKVAADQWQKARTLYADHAGPDDPDTLASMSHLAVGYGSLGRHAEALELHQETLARRRATLGPDHRETLMSMNNVAISQTALGRHAEALELHRQTLALKQAKLGADDPETLRSMYNLGRTYAALGRHADALKLHEETLALRRATLGPDHPDTLLSMTNLADTYKLLGRHADALELNRQTLALQRAKLGPTHPDTIASMNNLAIDYGNLGRHAEALTLFEEALALQTAKLGPDHPRTLLGMYNLACIHALMAPKSGDPAREADLAMELLKKAVAAGYKDLALINKDTDLNVLRGREDFNKLLAELEAREGKAKK
jgi:serine/threonine protein kinase